MIGVSPHPSHPVVSVVVPTRDRPEKLRRTVAGLRNQDVDPLRYEILVVDDGSVPPVGNVEATNARVIAVAHGERSRARNHGAERARGSILVFLDDDMLAGPTLVRAHWEAQQEWPGALAVGAIHLPDALRQTPFGRFRDVLEAPARLERGPMPIPNFAAAGNMSIPRDRFLALGGFDGGLISAEDQDLALRHTAAGGTIVSLPEALAVHDDSATTLRSYCRRTEWGARHLAPFSARYPDRPESRLRLEVNGPIRWRADRAVRILGKLAKQALSHPRPLAVLLAVTELVERIAPAGPLLPRLYRLCLGIHLQKGFREGWARTAAPFPGPSA
jgi:glycosyltransferase involved in cell wall biosynthesis